MAKSKIYIEYIYIYNNNNNKIRNNFFHMKKLFQAKFNFQEKINKINYYFL